MDDGSNPLVVEEGKFKSLIETEKKAKEILETTEKERKQLAEKADYEKKNLCFLYKHSNIEGSKKDFFEYFNATLRQSKMPYISLYLLSKGRIITADYIADEIKMYPYTTQIEIFLKKEKVGSIFLNQAWVGMETIDY